MGLLIWRQTLKLHFFGLFIINSIQGPAQTNQIEIPPTFYLFQENRGLINPALILPFDKADINLNFKGFTGLRKHVRLYSCSGYFQISKIDSLQALPKHAIGFNFIGNKQGEFINRNRFYGSYALYLSLSEKIKLASGFSFGAINYIISGSQVTSGTSSTNIDGSLGIAIFSAKHLIGVSSNQIFNNTIRPYQSRILVIRHYNLLFSNRFNLSDSYVLQTNFWTRFIPTLKPQINLNAQMHIQKHFYTGLTYRVEDGLDLVLGLDKMGFANGFLKISFLFNLLNSSDNLQNSNSYEINTDLKFPGNGLLNN